MKRRVSILTFVGLVASLGSLGSAVAQVSDAGKPSEAGEPRKVVKSEAEWAKILTREQFAVTRQRGTEPAFSGKFAHFKGKGQFACVGCGTLLFDAAHKFESGTGWPSFYRPIDPRRIETRDDYSMPAEVRVEVECATCGAHLGHVFNDGPRPTGLRFCLNSVALTLAKPAPEATPKTKAKATVKRPSPRTATPTASARVQGAN